MSKLKWTREGKGYDIIHRLYDSNGTLVAEAYRGGNMYYPWTWNVKGTKNHGDSLSLRNAKDAAEGVYLKELSVSK